MIDTPTSPITSGLPLFFVITVTAIKQVSDQAYNNFLILRLEMWNWPNTVPVRAAVETKNLNQPSSVIHLPRLDSLQKHFIYIFL